MRLNSTVEFTNSRNKNLIIIASVSELTTKEIIHLENVSICFNASKPITNGYFYESFIFLKGGKYSVFDRYINLVETNHY